MCLSVHVSQTSDDEPVGFGLDAVRSRYAVHKDPRIPPHAVRCSPLRPTRELSWGFIMVLGKSEKDGSLASYLVHELPHGDRLHTSATITHAQERGCGSSSFSPVSQTTGEHSYRDVDYIV